MKQETDWWIEYFNVKNMGQLCKATLKSLAMNLVTHHVHRDEIGNTQHEWK